VRIPEEKIQEIREATDIVEVISQYVTLKKRGSSFLGLCPFHTEKTPSFSVDPVRGFYHCFGCGVGGNVFTFLMQMERVSFPEAVRSLAERAGIPIPKYQEEDGLVKETEALYYSNQFAMKFFRESLARTEEGKKALEYLLGRGFTSEIAEEFQIGYAPESWDGLLKEARKGSIRPEILEKAGLVVPRKDERGYYDRFRGRLMFPVLNPSGRVVGFGGRTLTNDKKGPKYLNSPETRIFRKSRTLYGLFQSRLGIRREDRALLVEGYTDVMRLHQFGLDYGVATSGTALTEEQAKLLTRYTKNVILVFDGDSAGFNAAMRGVDVLVGAGLHVEVAPLPKGLDPDSFLRDRGREALEELFRASQNFIDFQLNRLLEVGKMKTPGDRAAAARRILDTVARIRDPLERNLMVKDVAEKLGVEEALLVRQMRLKQRRKVIEDSGPKKAGFSMRQAAERGLLDLLLENGEKWAKLVFKYLDPDCFQEREARLLVESLYEGFLRGSMPDASILMDRFSSDTKVVQYLTKLLTEEIGENVDRSQLGLDCLWSLRQNQIQGKIQEVQEKIKSSKNTGENDLEYRRAYINLREELERVKKEIAEAWKKNVEI
jgi:DNA primase